MQKPFLIGICGLKRSGKDTLAKFIKARWGYYCRDEPVITSFAEPLRAMLAPLLIEMGVDNPYTLMESGAKDSQDLPVANMPFRKMIQTLGTEWGRGMINDNFWVNLLLNRVRYMPYAIVSDVRFPNEAEAIRCHGVLIHLIRPGVVTGEHSSESGVPVAEGDVVVTNDAGLKELMSVAERIAATYSANYCFRNGTFW